MKVPYDKTLVGEAKIYGDNPDDVVRIQISNTVSWCCTEMSLAYRKQTIGTSEEGGSQKQSQFYIYEVDEGFDEYSLTYHALPIQFCPFCGEEFIWELHKTFKLRSVETVVPEQRQVTYESVEVDTDGTDETT